MKVLKYQFDMSLMFLAGLAIDQDIIQISLTKVIKVVSESSHWCIAEMNLDPLVSSNGNTQYL